MGDSFDTKAIDIFYTPDAEVTFPSFPPMRGHEMIKAFFDEQYPLIYSMEHK
jgi:hypothetical protein